MHFLSHNEKVNHLCSELIVRALERKPVNEGSRSFTVRWYEKLELLKNTNVAFEKSGTSIATITLLDTTEFTSISVK